MQYNSEKVMGSETKLKKKKIFLRILNFEINISKIIRKFASVYSTTAICLAIKYSLRNLHIMYQPGCALERAIPLMEADFLMSVGDAR